jgi:hypothetical protein
MLKKIVFAAALVVGFVTSFNVATKQPQGSLELVRSAHACIDPDDACKKTGGGWPW